jgi:hypothetical protein
MYMMLKVNLNIKYYFVHKLQDTRYTIQYVACRYVCWCGAVQLYRHGVSCAEGHRRTFLCA